MNRNIRRLTVAAMIAAVYFVLTMIFYVTSFQPLQSRLAEALTVLPYFTPVAIPGLFVGCILANILGGNGIWDVVVGSLASLLAAYLTYKLTYKKPKRKWLAPLPAVLINAVAVGIMLSVLANNTTITSLIVNMSLVGLGQLLACYVLGFPLMLLIERTTKLNELFKDIS